MSLSHEPKDVHIVLAALQAYGHVRPFRLIAKALIARGYSVSFITGTEWRDVINKIEGVEFVPLQGDADWHLEGPKAFQFPVDVMTGPDADLWSLENLFYGHMQEQLDTIQSVITRPDLANKKCIMIFDSTFVGHVPMFLEAEGARRIPLLGIGHFPLPIISKDTVAWGVAQLSQGEEQNKATHEQLIARNEPVTKVITQKLAPLKCAKRYASSNPWDSFVQHSDLYLQLTIPEMEPTRTDLPDHIRFIGALYGGNSQGELPVWFDEFVRKDTTGHPLLVVTSGTVPFVAADDLIIPTIEACRDLPVRLVVCGVNAVQPESLPSNVRWAKWLAFEEVFPYTAAFITNGGYNGINQAFAAGVPMILAGATEDKAEGTFRAACTGAAINLRAKSVSSEAVRAAILDIASNRSYKRKALNLKRSYARYDPIAEIEDGIQELVSEFY